MCAGVGVSKQTNAQRDRTLRWMPAATVSYGKPVRPVCAGIDLPSAWPLDLIFSIFVVIVNVCFLFFFVDEVTY